MLVSPLLVLDCSRMLSGSSLQLFSPSCGISLSNSLPDFFVGEGETVG